jgi:hypothetical protein
MRATLESLLEDQADFASMSKGFSAVTPIERSAVRLSLLKGHAKADWTRIS